MLCEFEEDKNEDNDSDAAIRKRMLMNKRLTAIKKDKAIPKRHYLMTSRFNNNSFSEMREYCRDSKSAKVVYGTPKEIAMYVPRDAIMFILEMTVSYTPILLLEAMLSILKQGLVAERRCLPVDG